MINNIELLAFIRDNLALARTIVIKNEKLALADNALMKAYYGLDSGSDKTKWRYYLNLNGEYHITDTMMQVKSLDDNELIDFTKENLEQHPATKKAYRLGGYYFSRLNTQYPGQSELIQGIINPISPEESIAASDFQILRYTKEYIHWNETQLIPALQDDIYKNVYQFYDTEYLYTDNLMAPALIAVMEKCIFEFLLECRFENRKTRFAHPFYIWSYLQSKGISPIYKDLLNAKQTMWLFRNIDYVLRNLGKTKTFEQLIDILLTERNIPLLKYDLILSTEEMRENLKPEPFYFSRRLNLIAKKGTGEDLHKVSKIMLKENPESLDNEVNYDHFLPNTREQSTFGKLANYPIKVLDSDLVDTTNRKPETIYSVLNNELIYLAGKGLYNINLDIEEPRTGIHHRITVKDAIVLWHYLLNKYHEADCDNIPSFYYQKALKTTPPKLSELLASGSKPFTTEEWCKDVLKTYIPQIRIVSPSVFYQNSLDILNLKWTHQKMYSRWLSIGYYSRRKNAISAMYDTGFMKLTDKKTYTEFLEQFEFDFEGYSKEDYFRLMWAIWKKMTGWDQFTHITIAQIQAGMIGLMKFLSSYSVQYVYQTVMEEGWYEGGIDLFTENPMLLGPNTDGQSELETNTSRWIPIHHRVTTDEEEEGYYFESGRFEKWSMLADLTEEKLIAHTPLLYPYDEEDDGGHDNVHDAYNIDMTNKYRNYNGPFPYNLEDLIPSGGSRANDHTLKEMIVDSFEGAVTAGPWTAKSIVIVDNNIDNTAVADDVDGFPYSKIIKTESFTKNRVAMNRYYIGFVPALLNSNVIKLDIVAVNSKTNEEVHVRFDYNIKTKQNTWAISFDIPTSVRINESFSVSQVITGLSLTDETIVNESYLVDNEITDYLDINYTNGKVTGVFKKSNWPDDLPIMYVLQTKNTNSDELLSRHYYYMKGLIPSDRYYDPLTDPVFEPTSTYNEADPYASVMERFSVRASNQGWTATNIYIKKNSNGSVPTNLVKTDYDGITDFLTPRLSDTKYIDKTADGVTTRTFEWLYAVASTTVSIPMILELTSDDGTVIQREFTYTPTVIDHGTQANYDIVTDAGIPFGVNLNNSSSLTVSGLKTGITLKGAFKLTRSPNSDSRIVIAHTGTPSVKDNSVITGYVVTPTAAITKDGSWGIQVSATTKSVKDATLMLYPYGVITITPEEVINYDNLTEGDLGVAAWGNLPLYTNAMAGTRFTVNTLKNGWELSSVALTKYNNIYHESITDKMLDHNGNAVYSGLTPTVVIGDSKDGNSAMPSGAGHWFTIKALGSKSVLASGTSAVSMPITIVVKNKYTNKTKTFNIKRSITFVNTEFALTGGVKNPTMLYPGRTNHIVPEWDNMPYSLYGTATKISSEGAFAGVDLYSGGYGYREDPTYQWNSDDTADITFPGAPLAQGRGIRIYNKRLYRSTATAYAGSSVQDIVYYPFIDYSTDEISRVEIPTLEDVDPTNVANPTFWKGVRSSAVVLINNEALTDKSWVASSINLSVLNTANESDYILSRMNGSNIKNYAYNSGIQNNPVGDAPDGKERYAVGYVSFTPMKEGKQTFTLDIVVRCTADGDIPAITFKHDIEVDVQPQEGVISYANSDPDPWWLVGVETFYLTQLSGLSFKPSSSEMLFAINSPNRDYLTVRGVFNRPLSTNIRSMGVTVKQAFSGFTPQAVVSWRTISQQGYYSFDPRADHYYFGLLDIRPDRLYEKADITTAVLDLQPDVIFPQMNQWESYTERYVYNTSSRGWKVSKMSYNDNYDWMNHCLTYDGYQRTNAQLGQNGTFNQSKDLTISAPDGKSFYLHTIGGFKVGTFNYNVNITLSNKHFSSEMTIDIVYPRTIEVVKSDISHTVDTDVLYIGQTTTLNGKFVNVPSADINPAVGLFTSNFLVAGANYGYFTPLQQPNRVTVKSDYVGNGNGIMLHFSTSYTGTAPNGKVESNTWYRRYRADKIIPEANIQAYVPKPSVADLDIRALVSPLTQGVPSALAFMYNEKAVTNKGYKCTIKGLKAYGTSQQDSVMMTTFFNKKFTDSNVYDYGSANFVPSDAPSAAAAYTYGYVMFAATNAGKQTFEIDCLIEPLTGGEEPYTLTISIDNTVYANEGKIDYEIKTEHWFAVGKGIRTPTLLSGITVGSLWSSKLIAAGVNDSNADYISTELRDNSGDYTLYVTALKTFDGVDRKYIVGHKANISEYPSTDKRRFRTYFGELTAENATTYSLDAMPPELIGFKEDIVFKEMEQFTTYIERYSYLRAPVSGWSVRDIRIAENTDWMNHVFSYDGAINRDSRLYDLHSYAKTMDYNLNAPSDRYFSLLKYGGRVLGTQTSEIVISVQTFQFDEYATGEIRINLTRNIVPSGISGSLAYSSLIVGKTNTVKYNFTNIPRPDLKAGIVPSGRAFTLLFTGQSAGYFSAYDETELTISKDYPVGSGNGVEIGTIHAYDALGGVNGSVSTTDSRVYRTSIVIPDSEINKEKYELIFASAEMNNSTMILYYDAKHNGDDFGNSVALSPSGTTINVNGTHIPYSIVVSTYSGSRLTIRYDLTYAGVSVRDDFDYTVQLNAYFLVSDTPVATVTTNDSLHYKS